jgi:serine O-acetyltransferase
VSINSKDDLKEYIKLEKELYLTKSIIQNLKLRITKEPRYFIWKFISYLRYDEYYINNKKSYLNKLILIWIRRRKNHYGNLLGLEIHSNTIGKGCMIYHYAGGIIVNSSSKIGENCKFHGMNCIGNGGIGDLGAPKLGNNVELGVGAKIIGDVYIADNIIIGANAVVTKSFYKPNIILMGIPATEKGSN